MEEEEDPWDKSLQVKGCFAIIAHWTKGQFYKVLQIRWGLKVLDSSRVIVSSKKSNFFISLNFKYFA